MDRLYGHWGTDVLQGGEGADKMWDGTEGDSFGFDVVSDLTLGARDGE